VKRQEIHIVVQSAASSTDLYRLLADARSWPSWASVDECEPEGLSPSGDEEVGTVRATRRGRTLGWDRVTELVPDQRLGYEHVKGLPVRDYLASVSLTPLPDAGTTITWYASFVPRWPGTGGLLRRGIEGFLRECAEGLAAHAASA
jgi:hypothetical protein